MKRTPDTRPTFVNLVHEALNNADDFCTIRQLITTHDDLNMNRVSAALHHLRKHDAADFMVSEGVTYWFAVNADNRTRTVDEKRREEPGTRKPRTGRRKVSP